MRAVVVIIALLVLAACGSPTTTQAGASRVDAPGPPEITAHASLPAGTPGAGRPTVVLGTKDFAEQFLLGELYAQALRAKGFTVDLLQNVGGSEIIDSAFASNQIQMYPEYLGEVAALAGGPAATTPLASYRKAQAFERSRRAAAVLDQTPYQNTDVVVVRREFAQQHGLASVGDLAGAGDVVLAAQPPFRTRQNGLAGMRAVYGLDDVSLLAVAPDETYSALDAGRAQAADGFSTDPQLGTGHYVELDDPRTVFGFQYVAPVVKQATLDAAGPAFAQTCNWVSSLLTVADVRAMNRQVQSDGADEATVARDFLARHGLR